MRLKKTKNHQFFKDSATLKNKMNIKEFLPKKP